MNINEHGFYIISNKFFTDFPDPYLKGNKEENRPHYYCTKDKNGGLYWVIPSSSRVEKYGKIIHNKVQKYGSCDILYIMEIANRKNVLLIQDMFPITKEYFLREYTINGIPLRILDNKEIKIIEQKFKKVLSLIRRGVKFTRTQPDVLSIEKAFLLQMETEKQVAATVDPESKE